MNINYDRVSGNGPTEGAAKEHLFEQLPGHTIPEGYGLCYRPIGETGRVRAGFRRILNELTAKA